MEYLQIKLLYFRIELSLTDLIYVKLVFGFLMNGKGGNYPLIYDSYIRRITQIVEGWAIQPVVGQT